MACQGRGIKNMSLYPEEEPFWNFHWHHGTFPLGTREITCKIIAPGTVRGLVFQAKPSMTIADTQWILKSIYYLLLSKQTEYKTKCQVLRKAF
jgi:hypothetical protein